jgi:hypothetical protein
MLLGRLESWVKGTSRVAPTVVTPKLYKNRLRNASEEYFLLAPDKWTIESTIKPSVAADEGELHCRCLLEEARRLADAGALKSQARPASVS